MTFESGSIALDVSPQTLDFGQDRRTVSTATVDISNSGTLQARQLVLSGIELGGSEELQAGAEITTLTYRGTDILGAVEPAAGDTNGNGIFDLDDLSQFVADSGVPLEANVGGNGLAPDGDETASFTVGISFDYSQITENGQTLLARVNFEARQQALDDDTKLIISAEDDAVPTESGSASTETP